MTVHVSVRSISALLLLSSLWGCRGALRHRRRATERVEVGVELAPDTFTLQPSTASGRGK